MSADNYIFIDLEKKPIEVWDCVASETVKTYETQSLDGQKVGLIGKAETIEEAIELARKFEDKLIPMSYVEYGIHFKLWCK